MLHLYNLLSFIALLLYFPFLLFKKGPDNKTAFITERLGLSRYFKTDFWVHAVSVGEVIASVPFLKALKKEFPGKRVVLSTTTYTGQKVAGERFPEADRIMYMPWDTCRCVRKAVISMKPEIFITVETELWPVLFSTLKKHGSKVIILNGRISNRSFAGYKRLGSIMKEVFSSVDFLYMQGETDAGRIIEIGADKYKTGIMGNFKFDAGSARSGCPDWLEDIRGRILLAASTHKGEEEIILDAFESVKPDYPDLKLIIAPRHPERFDEAADILRRRGFKFLRRSEIKGQGARGKGQGHYDVVLLDTIGELSQVFSGATIAFIGGSLVPVGGHNILEPAFQAKPVLFGPHMDNFPFATEFLDHSAAVRVRNAGDIMMTVRDLLDNDEKAALMGQRAKILAEKNTGAVEKAIGLIRGLIGTV
ncbi:MAG: 3-deoxy-D-manno-octulosonic acid transferase [Nitrospiraceae bacterium]|nr:MAG: 3-deoxy-D-manno-octulosonic acid transferase [Nitrospiraceae bacterium]